MHVLSSLFYKYDLYKYRKIVDYLYLPSGEVEKFLPCKNRNNVKYKIGILPPGSDNIDVQEYRHNKETNKLNVFYVGGISKEVYNFEKLLEVISNEENISFTICCREKEWEKMKNKYSKYLNDNIKIIHESGEKLNKYYKEADACSLLFDENDYMKIAMPVKLFEYLSHNKPIIATKGTVAGEFVSKNKIGWTINYSYDDIKNILELLKNKQDEIENVRKHQLETIKNNTWKVRANTVINDLITN